MQVTGTVLTVQARIDNNTNAQVTWSAHGKTFYTFDMTVRGPNGDVSGEISSTSVGVYPKAVGSIITVDSFEQNGWPKLKAISDQQQRGGQAQQQGQQQPAAVNGQEVDWDDIAKKKTKCAIICAGIKSGQLKCEGITHIDAWVGLVMGTVNAPANQPSQQPQQQQPQQQPQQQAPPPQAPPAQQQQGGGYGNDPALDENIPF